jgi:hypothetical protein
MKARIVEEVGRRGTGVWRRRVVLPVKLEPLQSYSVITADRLDHYAESLREEQRGGEEGEVNRGSVDKGGRYIHRMRERDSMGTWPPFFL